MAFDKKDLKKYFPNLAHEMDDQRMALPIDEVKNDSNSPLKSSESEISVVEVEDVDCWRGHNPQAEDFIRRASTSEEALEIIEYLFQRKEITPEKTEELKALLINQGLSAFGSKKRPGYYMEEAEKERLKLKMRRSPLSKG